MRTLSFPMLLRIILFYLLLSIPFLGIMLSAHSDAQAYADVLTEVEASETNTDLKEFTGVYEFNGKTLTVTLEDGALYGQPSDSSKEKIEHKEGDNFEVHASDGNSFKVVFQRTDGKVSAIKLIQLNGDSVMVAQKIK